MLTKSEKKRAKQSAEDWWLESNLGFDERAEFREIRKKLDELTDHQERAKRRFDYIFAQFIQCRDGGKVVLNRLPDATGFHRYTIQKDIYGFFVPFKLITTHGDSERLNWGDQGVFPTAKFFWLVDILQKIDPEKYSFKI